MTTQGQETALTVVTTPILRELDDRFTVEWNGGKPPTLEITTELFLQMVEAVNNARADRDSWARRFASVEKELNEKTEQVLALHLGDETHCIECGSPKPCATASIFAGPSSVADYELLGTPVEDKQ